MNKQTRIYKTTKRELVVAGHTWEGFQTNYTYPLDLKTSPMNLRDARMIAGDFQNLSSAVVVVTITQIKETLQTVVLH